MSVDLLFRGARLVDGSGAPARDADVAVAGGRIAAIEAAGRFRDGAERTVDAGGLVLTPGFIDVHTHYDAQLHWDPTASASSWHGVTTVICGNCGFTLFPARPEDCGWLAQMLSRVEGMAPEALAAGLRFAGGGFAEYWGELDGRIGVNAACYVGHSAVRRFVLGEEASERRATPEEIGAMQDLLRQALREGAHGFSSSQLAIHVAHDGREVPSNHAAPEELVALCSVLREFEHGAIEFIPKSFVTGYDEADRKLLLEMARASGCAIELNHVTPLPSAPDGWRRSVEFAREAAGQGLSLHPMLATNRMGAYFALDSTFLFDELPTWRETLTRPIPERMARLREPAVRESLGRELASAPTFAPHWAICVVEAVRDEAHRGWVGRSVAELAAERGQDPFECFLDLSLEEDLETTFAQHAPPSPALRQVTQELLDEPLTSAGSSDAGAHLLSLVGVDYTTRLLAEWVPEPLSLEQAVARITSEPARRHGLRDRGVVREGAWADLVLFDPERLAAGATRLLRDFPARSARLVVDAEGYVATFVNGRALLEEGHPTGALPGRVLRAGT